MLTFLCCLVVVSGIHSFGVMLWLIAVGMAWFFRLGMEWDEEADCFGTGHDDR